MRTVMTVFASQELDRPASLEPAEVVTADLGLSRFRWYWSCPTDRTTRPSSPWRQWDGWPAYVAIHGPSRKARDHVPWDGAALGHAAQVEAHRRMS
jgi:hypothetical protein